MPLNSLRSPVVEAAIVAVAASPVHEAETVALLAEVALVATVAVAVVSVQAADESLVSCMNNRDYAIIRNCCIATHSDIRSNTACVSNKDVCFGQAKIR